MKLYRGENINNWAEIKKNRFVRPKSNIFEIVFKYNGMFKYDGSILLGPSKINAVNGHQIDSSEFYTSGISTTPFWDIAKKYALHNGKYKSGIIMEFDSNNIDMNEYEIIVVADYVKEPKCPLDAERILKRHDNMPIPLNFFKIHLI